MEVIKAGYKVKQIYTSCLAQASYVISSQNQAAIVDPLRDVDQYIKILKDENLTLKYIIETHFHADFVSGHMDLQKHLGGEIVFGPGAKLPFKVHNAKHEELLPLGKINLQVLHTPGHTPESSSFVLIDEDKKIEAVFTGDTLFVGDVGRPDLLESLDLTAEDLAGHLYNSIHNVLGRLPPECILYPGHGPGSPCGKKIGKETTSTIGNEKATNYAFQMTDKKDFITAVVTGLTAPPSYFIKNAIMNKEGPENLDGLIDVSLKPLNLEQFEAEAKKGAMILDVRTIPDYNKGSIPNSMHHALDGMFSIFIGTMISELSQPIVLVAPVGREREAIVRLNRVGYKGTVGYLEGGFEAYLKTNKPVVKTASISPKDFASKLVGGKTLKEGEGWILDVRKDAEREAFSMEPSKNIPLQSLKARIGELEDVKNKKLYVTCAAGYRASIATSVLNANNFGDIVFVEGGTAKIREALSEIKH